MATPEQYILLRELINEPDDTGGWTDERLDQVFAQTVNQDGSANVRRAAGVIWESKAADYVELTDTAESGSQRRNSQAFDHAQKMALHFAGSSPDPGVIVAVATMASHRIVRPTRG